MTTQITPIWVAYECLRLYKNMDALGRCPDPLTLILGSRYKETVRSMQGPHAPALVLSLLDTQWSPSDHPDDLRERVLRPLVRDAMIQRGVWSSAFRKHLKDSWRIHPVSWMVA